jgi:hypothetical protein
MVLEDDYNYLKRIEEYGKRRWKEPLLCTYLWDRYDLNTQLLNRQRLICRSDVDYAYDDDYNLKIVNSFNTVSPFKNQVFRASSEAYNQDGSLEEGHLIFYIKDDEGFRLYGESPINFKVTEDFEIVVKYYPLSITSYANSINPDDEVNVSDVTKIHVRDYKEADYFVSNSGDDSNPGDYTHPFKTLQHASDIVLPGETICVLTSLNLSDSVLIYTDCNLIAKDATITSDFGWFLSITPGTSVYIQNLVFSTHTGPVFNYKDGAYIQNHGGGLVSVESLNEKQTPSFNLDLESDDYWVSGETVDINISGLKNESIYILDSLNECIYHGGQIAKFKYTVPHGLEYDTLSIIIPEYNYMFSKSFSIYNIEGDWYVDTINGEDYTHDGKSLTNAFKTLEWALQNVTPSLNRVFFKGLETIDNLEIPSKTIIRGLKNNSIIRCNTDSFFNVKEYLSINDMLLNDTLIDSVSFENQGSFPLEVCNLDHRVEGVVFVDGLNGKDTNSGYSWSNAFKTLAHALSFDEDNMIYFSGENTINTPLKIYHYIQIVGTMNKNQLYNSNGTYFEVGTNQVLKLSDILLKSSTKTTHILNNTYTNNGNAKLEVIT